MAGGRGRTSKCFASKRPILLSLPAWIRDHLRSEEVSNQSTYVEEALSVLLPIAWKKYIDATWRMGPQTIVRMFSKTPKATRVKVFLYFPKSVANKLQSVDHPGVLIERTLIRYYELSIPRGSNEPLKQRKPYSPRRKTGSSRK